MTQRYQEGFVAGCRKGRADCEPEIERLRAALGELLDAHWPFVETQDHEDPVCAQARAALGGVEQLAGD